MFITDTNGVIIDIADNIIEIDDHIIVSKNGETIYYARQGLTVIDLVPPEDVTPQRYIYINGTFAVMPIPPVPTIPATETDKQGKIIEINQAFTKALNTQFTSEATGYTYDYSPESQTSFTKLAIAMITGLQTYPIDIALVDQVTYVPHDQMQCQQVLASISAFEDPLRAKKKTLLEEVATANTLDEINAISW